MHAANRGIATVVRAEIIIIAIDESVLAAEDGVASIGRAGINVVAADGRKHASLLEVAQVGSASVSIEARRDRCQYARSVEGKAGSHVARVRSRAVDRGEHAERIASLDVAGIDGAEVIVGADDRLRVAVAVGARSRVAGVGLRALIRREDALSNALVVVAGVVGAGIIVVVDGVLAPNANGLLTGASTGLSSADDLSVSTACV